MLALQLGWLPLQFGLLAQTAPVDNPWAWFASLGTFAPIAGVMWYLYTDTRKDRDRYRDLVFSMMTEYKDAMQSAALAQEKMAQLIETRMLSEDELGRFRRALERILRRKEEP